MCYSQAEGGQRCYGSAKAKLDRAAKAADADPCRATWDAYQDAEIEFCSTPQGEAEMRSKIAEGVTAGDDMELARHILAAGLRLREKNAAVRDAVRKAKR